MKVFLGGTCNNSNWRSKLIDKLKVDYFNPVVDNWTEECQKEEERQKKICDIQLYVITPFMTGVFSIAEVVESSNKCPEKTVFCVLKEDEDCIHHDLKAFGESELKSLKAVENMVKRNGVKVFNDLDSLASYLNGSRKVIGANNE